MSRKLLSQLLQSHGLGGLTTAKSFRTLMQESFMMTKYGSKQLTAKHYRLNPLKTLTRLFLGSDSKYRIGSVGVGEPNVYTAVLALRHLFELEDSA